MDNAALITDLLDAINQAKIALDAVKDLFADSDIGNEAHLAAIDLALDNAETHAESLVP